MSHGPRETKKCEPRPREQENFLLSLLSSVSPRQVFGQDYNNEAFAVCCSDMMIKGQNPENIKFGDCFTQDGPPEQKFDYLLANPFGVEWKPQTDVIEREHDEQGFKGHVPRNQAKWSFRRISSKLLKRLVAARGLEPRTYGL